jgi:tetratricopeptide (TPR) repeat protein
MSDTEVESTQPAVPGATDDSVYAAQVKPPASNKPSALMWFGMGGLVIVALLVIFVLPSLVTEYELPLERRVDVSSMQSPANQSGPESSISPFEEAQRSIQRKEAQDILAELLEIQGELDALEVEEWGEDAFTAALAVAATGDDYYRSQDFLLASDYYSNGRDQLADLRASVPDVHQRLLIEGQNALDAANAEVSQDRYSLALVLDPQSEAAQIGLERAQALEEVTALFQQAEELREDGELEQARQIYARIIELDSYNERAPAMIAEVDAQLIDNEFNRIMSEGYVSLEANDPQAAIAAFQRASNLGIRQDEAEAAIVQTETQVANAEINSLRAAISDAENNERWQDAADAYTEVLSIDANLLFAIQGQDYASKRAQLDRLLEQATNNPERLSEEAVYQQTLDVYFTGRGIEGAGPRLVAQLDELEGLLENSQIPVTVRLVSDAITDVTLLRVGNLGTFEQTSVELKPGRYVAVGKRPGFRDVREEFIVGFGQTPDAVDVRCSERVIGSSGR